MHRIAIAGFRHGHIFDLHQRALDHPDLELAATCEENYEASLMPAKGLSPDFTSFEKLLAETDCDIIALGDTYGRRGAQAIAALKAGKHVIADKPLCTSLHELDEIEALAKSSGLHVGLMFDIRDHGNFRALREVVSSGRIGAVQTVCTAGQHPLLHGTRPGWYFEDGQHGGTLNDIAIHAIDFIPWLTGRAITGVAAARSWNGKATFAPRFRDCGQFMLTLENGGGVIGDVSYLAPDASGYAIPNYWRVTLHGTRGFAETSWNAQGITVADDLAKEPELIPTAAGRPGGYLEDFLAELAGKPAADGLTTASCLAVSRLALQLEAAAI